MAKKARTKKADEPLRIDMPFEDALRHVLKAKPVHRAVATPALTIRRASAKDDDSIVTLWRKCAIVHAGSDPLKEIARSRAFPVSRLFVGMLDGRLVATVMVGYDGRRGWVNYLAVDPASQRQGVGRAMMVRAEQRLLQLGCPKVNLQVRVSNASVLAFYARLGYSDDKVVSLGKRLISD